MALEKPPVIEQFTFVSVNTSGASIITDLGFLAERFRGLFGNQTFNPKATIRIRWKSQKQRDQICIYMTQIRVISEANFSLWTLDPRSGPSGSYIQMI
jgi:hypothetical protein